MTEDEVRLADEDPKVERWPAEPGRYFVEFSVEGLHSPELEEIIKSHVQPLGVKAVHRSGMKFTLFGVAPGREAEVLGAVAAALSELNRTRQDAREQAERERPAREAAAAAAEAELEAVREAFRAARRESG